MHKLQCRPAGEGISNDITLKLAERFVAVERLMELLIYHSILNLDLLSDRSNANRFAVNVTCTTKPADLKTHLQRSLAGQDPDPNAILRLVISSITRVPLDKASAPAQRAAAECRAKGIRDPITNTVLPIVTVYFTSDEGEGLLIGSVFATCIVQEWHMAYMASNPKAIQKSAMAGESEVDLNMETILV